MTTEDDFQAALDAHPDDWQTRLVLADWLEERDDPRAEGYRALGVQRYSPEYYDGASHPYSWWSAVTVGSRNALDSDWFAKIKRPRRPYQHTDADFDTRRESEDAAALAFTKLPAARRAELLATVTV